MNDQDRELVDAFFDDLAIPRDLPMAQRIELAKAFLVGLMGVPSVETWDDLKRVVGSK